MHSICNEILNININNKELKLNIVKLIIDNELIYREANNHKEIHGFNIVDNRDYHREKRGNNQKSVAINII